ncbi:MAG: methylmalonyl-CoA mutase [Euryarchaeota archaeon]|nr:methylmalonyl-CoA mutase [Euryarchaeota archaeon]MDE1836117.1 methylmalonyl-CoA mutase [Euryarchaeota archaeon]MDE1879407.1 methylmalonyl-CoA mutase [Euryarchaeota archaeon]MDE2044095.1 methylmalonyl-CoA mutase [Thermoplasmata archaeon]
MPRHPASRPPRSPEEARWRKEVEEKLPPDERSRGDPPALGLPEEDEAHRYEAHLGFPGRPPFTRGVQPTMYRGRLWTMRQYSGFGTAEETNARFRDLLAHGQTGLSVAFDLPTQIGYDPDHPRSKGEVGRCGVSISTLRDMESLFHDIPLDKATVSMTINATATILLGLLVNVAEAHGVSRARLGGTVQNDVLKEYAARGTYIYPPDASLRLTADLIEFTTREMPQWNGISVSGYHMREAGATAAQEVAFTLSDGIAYARAVKARGLPVDEFLPRVSFFFSADRNFLEEVAKFRAARRLWSRLTSEALGAKSSRARELRFHTQTAGSSLTAQQPELNVVRTTLEALSAVLGGTQSLHTNAMDEALGLPTPESARLALRTQQILAEESGVPNTVDPLGGAWAIEDLTDRIEEDAQRYLDQIEEMGGASVAVARGFYQKEIGREAYLRARSLEERAAHVVGVNVHAEGNSAFDLFPGKGKGTGKGTGKRTPAGTAGPRGQRISPELERKAVRAVVAWRKARRAPDTERAISSLRKATEEGRNVMPQVIEALKKGTTLGEIAGLWREIFGEHHPSREY